MLSYNHLWSRVPFKLQGFVCFDFCYMTQNTYVSLSVSLSVVVFFGGWRMNSTSGHSVVELKEPATLTHSLNIQPNKRERDNLSPSLAVSNRHQAGDHNWKNLFRGPASAATVTTPITKHSQGSWHKETHWAVVIHFRWALSHEDRHRRPEQQTEERSLRFLSQQEKVEQSSTGSDELWGAEVGCHKNFSGFQSPPPSANLFLSMHRFIVGNWIGIHNLMHNKQQNKHRRKLRFLKCNFT